MDFGLRWRRALAGAALGWIVGASAPALAAEAAGSTGAQPVEPSVRAIAPPGECATARPHVALYTTPLDPSRVASSDAPPSDLADVLGPTSERFDPNDVAAGGDGSLSPPPPPSPAPPNPCSGVCAGPVGPSSPPPIAASPRPAVVESPPVFRPPPGLPIVPKP